MDTIRIDHFLRAAEDLGAHGDNDTLPFDIDVRFLKNKKLDLATTAFEFFKHAEALGKKESAKLLQSLNVFSERLLVPTGPSGFRITTKIHPFWNIYFNGLGVAVADKNEPLRAPTAHSYRFEQTGEYLFSRQRSWRAYKEAAMSDPAMSAEGAVVVQTDIASFYEHIYHHRIENLINDLFPPGSTVATQIICLLSKFSAGRSFGLPVGGQCARILAEVLMTHVDQRLNDENIVWHRYVDDFTVISDTQNNAYKSLSVLSHILADYGLTLNRSKTTIINAKHFIDLTNAQIGASDDDSKALHEIDLHFDPYSDSATADYSELKKTVQRLDVHTLLNLEIRKAQPDTFLVAQISRTLKLHSPLVAFQLCSTLLEPGNLNSFRASWSTIMRGVAAVRAEPANKVVFDKLDELLDEIPTHSSHLILAEASLLHYLRAIRFCRTETRAKFVLLTHKSTNSESVKRACIECWRLWEDRASIIRLVNMWQNMTPEEQRMTWFALYKFGDDGSHARKQRRASARTAWALGIEGFVSKPFFDIYTDWAQEDV